MTFSFNDDTSSRVLMKCIPEEGETTIVIPDGVVYIHDAALRHCSEITRVVLPSTIRSLTGEPFSTMRKLECIDVAPPDDGSGEDKAPFYSCDGVLYRRDPANGNRYLVRYPAGRKAAAFQVPVEVKIIGRSAFSNAVHIQEITLCHHIWDIQAYAFSGCPALRFVQVGSSELLFVREGAFRFCPKLEEIYFCPKRADENDVYMVEDLAFDGCVSLRRLCLPDGLSKLGKWVFVRCASLEHLRLPGSVTSIGMDAFYDSNDDMKILCTREVAELIPQYHDRIVLVPCA